MYGALGRLSKDANPAGQWKTLARSERTGGYTVALTTRLGRTRLHDVSWIDSWSRHRSVTEPDGTAVAWTETGKGSQVTHADGTTRSITLGPDARFGMVAPVTSQVVATPAGLTFTAVTSRTATLATPTDPLSATVLGETLTVNGRVFNSTFTVATGKLTSRTAMGRTVVRTLDSRGRVARLEWPGVPAIDYTYSPEGRLRWVTQGTRSHQVEYDAAGLPWKVTDPMSRQVTLEYDQAGRPWRTTLPGGRQVLLGSDASGNLTSLTPPGRPAHGFGYDPADRMSSYTPPALPDVTAPATTYGYDLDGALSGVLLPDSTSIVPGYDVAGRLTTVTTARGTSTVGYDSAGRVWTVAAPEGEGLTLGYDGFLPRSEVSSGPVAGTVSRTFDNDYRVSTVSVNGAAVSYGYDADGLLIQAGGLTIARSPSIGRVDGTTLGTVTTTQGYSTYGELATVSASAGSAVYSFTLSRDASGRITGKTETVLGETHEFAYGYDGAGRLASVTRDGIVEESWLHDDNGNRLTRTTAGGTESGTYDDQDRMRSFGSASYGYGAGGDLRSRTVAGQTTWYGYDGLGNLMQVALPDGRTIDYVVDGLDRRVGKKVNGTLVEGFLYDGQLRPVAWLNGAGQVYATFVYGLKVNVPEYMTTSAGTFRILTDHLGSPRLVVNTTTGAVAQRMDYDAWGQLLADTSPGFQPFGFAGGIYDRDTGLVRFGARDYEPVTGRWTNKDPVGFNGGDANLYVYVGADPLNWIDPDGLDWTDWDVQPYADFVSGFGDIVTGIPFTDMSLTGLIRRWDGTDKLVNKCSNAYLGGMVTGVAWQVAFNAQGFRTGHEFKFKFGDRNFRVAPWGNRTDNPLGQAPHYHRNIPDAGNPGQSIPGGGIGRHRPWQGF